MAFQWSRRALASIEQRSTCQDLRAEAIFRTRSNHKVKFQRSRSGDALERSEPDAPDVQNLTISAILPRIIICEFQKAAQQSP